jgi:hypothetical protein
MISFTVPAFALILFTTFLIGMIFGIWLVFVKFK